MYEVLSKYTQALSVALGYRDPLTQLHSERVRGLAEELGIQCGLSNDDIGILKIAASFHDIGKIGIPDPVLLKPGSYDEDDWKVMKMHPHIGAEIILATQLEGAKQAADVIRGHHEHYDGSGYPEGLSGEEIPVLCRIISIVDAYDAMAMTRSYHQARSHAQIMQIIHREAGTIFDPDLLKIFEVLMETSDYRATS
jgi:HD-GYP domain-containing protein (c-di-GMP phosphodiesterase class II)